MLLAGHTTEFYTTGVGGSAYRSKATPFAGETCETTGNRKKGKLLEGRLAEQFCRTVRSHLSSFNMIPVCFGALRGRLAEQWR